MIMKITVEYEGGKYETYSKDNAVNYVDNVLFLKLHKLRKQPNGSYFKLEAVR